MRLGLGAGLYIYVIPEGVMMNSGKPLDRRFLIHHLASHSKKKAVSTSSRLSECSPRRHSSRLGKSSESQNGRLQLEQEPANGISPVFCSWYSHISELTDKGKLLHQLVQR